VSQGWTSHQAQLADIVCRITAGEPIRGRDYEALQYWCQQKRYEYHKRFVRRLVRDVEQRRGYFATPPVMTESQREYAERMASMVLTAKGR
jgi:hypothetical protein